MSSVNREAPALPWPHPNPCHLFHSYLHVPQHQASSLLTLDAKNALLKFKHEILAWLEDCFSH